jgi:hypothetical protein
MGPANKRRYSNGKLFQHNVEAHNAVLAAERWFGNGDPQWPEAFTAEKTRERRDRVLAIVLRAANRAAKDVTPKTRARDLFGLFEKLAGCRRRHRCGSLACPLCARAYQRAKVAAQEKVIAAITHAKPKKRAVFVTLIPKRLMFSPNQLSDLDICKANRWLKDVLRPIGNRVILGSADLGWETRRSRGYIQVHWHLVMWTGSPNRLGRQIRALSGFCSTRKYERPVHLTPDPDNGVLPYINKVTRLPDLLRRNRKNVADVLLALDQMDPFDVMVLRNLRLRVGDASLVITQGPNRS